MAGLLHVCGTRSLLCHLLQFKGVPFIGTIEYSLAAEQFCVDCCDNLCMGVREAFRVFMVGATMLIVALVPPATACSF